jgi:hypothetical protein
VNKKKRQAAQHKKNELFQQPFATRVKRNRWYQGTTQRFYNTKRPTPQLKEAEQTHDGRQDANLTVEKMSGR